MKTKFFYMLLFLLVFNIGCTTAGSKFIQINYIGLQQTPNNQKIGISPFLDKREIKEKKFIGKRILNSGNEEIYFVNGAGLDQTITQNFESYFHKTGYQIEKIDPWEPSIEKLKTLNKTLKYVISGEIKEFEFFAVKDFKTTMTLDIKLIIYIGDLEKNIIKTVPANLSLKRTDLNFSKERVEMFMSESITEIILKSFDF